MNLKTLQQIIIYISRKTIHVIIINCIAFSTIYGIDLNAQEIKSVRNTSVELHLKNATLLKVFKEIESRTDYKFAFQEEDLSKRVRMSLSFKNASVAEVLMEVSKQAYLKFKQINNTIHISKRSKTVGTKDVIEVVIEDIIITGRVTSKEEESGLPGVNVIVKGLSLGTVTDIQGNYSLDVPDVNSILVFSSVGYVKQEILVGNQTIIDLVLEEDIKSLEEIVVTGYGTQEKKEITSSITSVKEEDFNVGMVNDPAQLIQGKVAGLNITRPGGDPNDSYTIRLRGVSTIGANQEPLIVIDGIVGASLDQVDPADIASIDVLKDGSAAAIYGTRGSSGVILVTTKTGKAGILRVDYNGSVAFDNVANTMDFMSASQYRSQPGAIDLGSNNDWLDLVTQTGVSQIHNLSMSGGTPSTTYRASVNFRDIQGIAINTGFQRINGRLNITQKALNDRATFTLNLSHTNQDSKFGPGDKDVFRYAVLSNPTVPVLFDGSAGLSDIGGYAERDIFDYWNPVSIAEQGINDGKDINTTGQLRFAYDFADIVNGLRAEVAYSQQIETELRGAYLPSTLKFGDGNANNGNAARSTVQKQNQLFEAILNWDKSFGNTNIAVLGGYSFQDFVDEGFSMSGGQFLTDEFTYNNMSASEDFANGLGSVESFNTSHTLIAYFGRVNLNFNDVWFLSASIRREGSSRFGENNKWGNFPAVSGAVNLTNLFSLGGFDDLKLRASFGKTGALPGRSFISLQKLEPTGNFFFDGSYIPSYGPVSNANPDLAWETKDEFDIGLDFVLFNGKLSGTMDYYIRSIKDMILPVNVPVPPNLFPVTDVNIGELKSNGFEFAVNWSAINTSNLTYDFGFNFSTFNTDVKSLTSGDLSFGESGVLYRANMGSPGQSDVLLVRVKEGDPLGNLWGQVQVGVNPDGTLIFKDINGDGTICRCDDDRQVIGNGLPDFSIGWNNGFTFGKGWDANFFFRGTFGHDLLNTYRGFYENLSGPTVSNWNIVNTRFFNPDITEGAVNNVHVENASFFKLDNMSIGYNFGMENSKTFSNIRLYVAGQNLFTITDYTGIDPEVRYVDTGVDESGDDPDDALSPGIERRNTYFTTRTVTIGLSLGF